MTPDPSTFAKPCAITAGAFCLTHRASTTDPRSDRCVAVALKREVDRLRAGIAREHRNVERYHLTRTPEEAASLTREGLRDLLNPTRGD